MARSFLALYRAEQRLLGGGPTDGVKPRAMTFEGSAEPRISYTPYDRVGLALSGGGIRSATFNLGVLQGLHRLGLLPLVDYLSTVSGGGYVGGWWTAWRSRPEHRDRLTEEPFPGSPAGVEPSEVRHLREFSRFLLPRLGFFEIETWNGIVVVLGGAIIGIAAANAAIMAFMFAWGTLTAVLLAAPSGVAATVLALSTTMLLFSAEASWRRSSQQLTSLPFSVESWIEMFVCVGIPLFLSLCIWTVLASSLPFYATSAQATATPATWDWARAVDAWVRPSYDFGWLKRGARLMYPAICWASTAGVMMIVRFVFSRFRRGETSFRLFLRSAAGLGMSGRTPFPLWGRTTARLLVASIAWCGFAAVGAGACYIHCHGHGTMLAAVTSVASALFAWARRLHPPTASRPETRTVPDRLRPLVPQLLAYLGLACGSAFATWLMIWLFGRWGILRVVAAWATFVGFFLLCFDPEVMGLHAFYRARIVRAYLGASNPNATRPSLNRGTDYRHKDDVELAATTEGTRKLIHLICCTANGLADDPLGNLARGGRSAVLSGNGISIGDCWGPAPGLRMSTALTASAAAFNTCMGSASMRLGPAVRFLMAALNFRLGLWLRHPGKEYTRRFRWENLLPGLLFVREMFGRVRSDGMTPNRRPSDVHLSDGGHFENLGLYELVRRHCRYIIVSDCGEDHQAAFDDFGNAIRRIREDFGVEIEIDIGPLRPMSNGFARQHMVAGTIFYDRQRSNDRGILLYFKPALEGAEPDDVTQYKARNLRFPHETTGDQLYDEAQWEAYRRLGEHSVGAALGFLGRGMIKHAHQVFTASLQRWRPIPPDLHSEHDRLSARYAEFERRAIASGTSLLMDECFPEARAIRSPSSAHRPLTTQQLAEALPTLLELVRLMEGAVTCCRLDTHPDHPLNTGWVNVFQRWVATRPFRFWWPVIRALHSPRLQELVEQRIEFVHAPPPVGVVTCRAAASLADLPPGLATEAWCRLMPQMSAVGMVAFSYILTFTDGDERSEVQVGLAQVSFPEPHVAQWRSNHFLVLPGLWGTEIGKSFLRKMVSQISDPVGINRARCIVALAPHAGGQRATDSLHADLIDFYLGAGFRLTEDGQHLVWSVLSTRA